MEQILNKLSEIELTAQHIMEDCNKTKKKTASITTNSWKLRPLPRSGRSVRNWKRKKIHAFLPCVQKQKQPFPLWTHITMKITCAFPKNFSRRSWNCKKHC